MQAITWMEYVGMAAFAFSAAQVAIARRMDLFLSLIHIFAKP